MAVRGIIKRNWMKEAIYNNRDEIREKLSIGRGDNYGWDINQNAELMRPSFSLEQYTWHYFFGKRPAFLDEEQGEKK